MLTCVNIMCISFAVLFDFPVFICSLKQLQHTTDKVDEIALALYRKILDEVSAVGARVVKIIFKPSCDSTARLMENGDFRVKFQDGISLRHISSSSRINSAFKFCGIDNIPCKIALYLYTSLHA